MTLINYFDNKHKKKKKKMLDPKSKHPPLDPPFWFPITQGYAEPKKYSEF